MPNPVQRLFGNEKRYLTYLRVAASGTACSNLLLAVGTLQLHWLFLPPVWAAFYLVAGGTCALLARYPKDHRLVALAGAATIVAHIMRGAVLLMGKSFNLAEVGKQPWPNVFVGCVAWWSLAYFAVLLFFTRFEPLASASRARS